RPNDCDHAVPDRQRAASAHLGALDPRTALASGASARSEHLAVGPPRRALHRTARVPRAASRRRPVRVRVARGRDEAVHGPVDRAPRLGALPLLRSVRGALDDERRPRRRIPARPDPGADALLRAGGPALLSRRAVLAAGDRAGVIVVTELSSVSRTSR